MNILIAEDESMMRHIMTVVLKRENYNVIAVSNGEEAIQYLQKHKVDLVITDIHMPEVNGFELVGWIRKHLQHTRIIVLSSLCQEHVVVEAFGLGADEYVTKPFSPNELNVRVKKLFMRSAYLSGVSSPVFAGQSIREEMA